MVSKKQSPAYGLGLLLVCSGGCDRATQSAAGAGTASAAASSVTATTAAPDFNGAIQRIVPAVMGRQEVMVTVRLQFRPGEAETNKRVRVASVEFGADGQLASVVLLDGTVRLVLPASAFEKRLVLTEPIAIVDGAKK